MGTLGEMVIVLVFYLPAVLVNLFIERKKNCVTKSDSTLVVVVEIDKSSVLLLFLFVAYPVF